jgi:branched-chain amino acid transport system permease protein
VSRALAVGLFQGAAYGLLAMGIVLVHRNARTFNVAQGEFGSAAAFVAFGLFHAARLPYGVAGALALVFVAGLGVGVERLVVRPLADSAPPALVLATAGVALGIIAASLLGTSAQPSLVRASIAAPQVAFLRTRIGVGQLLVVPAVVGIGLAMQSFLRSNFGLAVSAAGEDRLAARTLGVDAARASGLVWALAALLGGLAGIVLLAAQPVLVPGFVTMYALVPAFAAAVMAGMRNLTGAAVAGLAIGLTQGFVSYVVGQKLGVPGTPELVAFVVLLAVLTSTSRGRVERTVA